MNFKDQSGQVPLLGGAFALMIVLGAISIVVGYNLGSGGPSGEETSVQEKQDEEKIGGLIKRSRIERVRCWFWETEYCKTRSSQEKREDEAYFKEPEEEPTEKLEAKVTTEAAKTEKAAKLQPLESPKVKPSPTSPPPEPEAKPKTVSEPGPRFTEPINVYSGFLVYTYDGGGPDTCKSKPEDRYPWSARFQDDLKMSEEKLDARTEKYAALIVGTWGDVGEFIVTLDGNPPRWIPKIDTDRATFSKLNFTNKDNTAIKGTFTWSSSVTQCTGEGILDGKQGRR